MMVAIGHTMLELQKVTAFGDPTFQVPWNYGFGVDLFFVISGFIMMYTAGGGFGDSQRQRRFLFARLARIGPLYWLMTTAYLAIALLAPSGLNGAAIDAKTVIGSYLFIPVANARGVVLPLLAVGWTLNFEMLFYVIFTLAMFLPPKWGRWTVVGTLLVVPLAGWILDPSSPVLHFWTDSIVIEFAFGALLGIFVTRLASAPLPLAWVLTLAGAAGFVLPYIFNLPDLGGPRFLVAGIPAAMIVAGAVNFDIQKRTVDSPPLRAVGDASYSLYLTHLFIVRASRVAWNHFIPVGPTWAFCPLTVSAAVLAGLTVAALIELPLHGWTKARSRRIFPTS